MNRNNALKALETYYGYKQFRPMQAEIIEQIYSKKDVLVLMPTGGGKSVCYQIPAITMPGTGIVVSPLIALMKDQVEALTVNGVRATYLNSSQSLQEQRQIEEKMIKGEYDLVYVSPEKILSKEFTYLMMRTSIALFAIDEAHCISAWGHDFRPEYTQLQLLKNQFPNVPVVACTATADDTTRRDIVKQLGLVEPAVYVASFDRPNLRLEVRPGLNRMEQIIKFVQERPKQSGIIYCISRKETEKIAQALKSRGVSAAFYHAGIENKERSKIQEDFIQDRTPIVCATIAFGMGIDKSNVRWVIHYNMPKNLEGFYQEIGRAGRDGAEASTLLFYSYGDVEMWKRIIAENAANQNLEIQLAKLTRMQQYATTLFCRRKVLLNYFSEDWRHQCNNCDVCSNPPQYFDGTIPAQKALSAVYRSRERVNMNLLIDLLRGSQRKEVFENELHLIKTYGAGKEYNNFEWRDYIEQLLNQGYLALAPDDGNRLRITPAGHAVLFEAKKVELIKPTTIKEKQSKERAIAEKKASKQPMVRLRDELFEALRDLRNSIAKKDGIPPYVVFSDLSLEEMAGSKPTNEAEIKAISGVSEMKWLRYGNQFLEAIKVYCLEHNIPLTEKPQKGTNTEHQVTYSTSEEFTYELYLQGLDLEAIAQKRSIGKATISFHLIGLYKDGKEIDINRFVPKAEQDIVRKAVAALGLEPPYRLKPIFEYLEGKVNYEQIRLVVGLME